ncbi:calcium-binding protein [Parasedimentitalea marina]|uniref:calcium-binding protein n=1 Tax=Parasedimentitalea marina TaxID=2483033 RepID=UPI003B849CF6
MDGAQNEDRLYGGVGDDTLLGGAYFDTLFGGIGDDTLHGGAQADQLMGEWGNDLLSGGDGNDTLWGLRTRTTCLAVQETTGWTVVLASTSCLAALATIL